MKRTNEQTVFGDNLMDCNYVFDQPPDLDDWCQRLKETPYDPLEDIRQEHESWLAELEGLAVKAIASGNWTPVLEHLNEIMAWQDRKLPRCPKSQKPALIV